MGELQTSSILSTTQTKEVSYQVVNIIISLTKLTIIIWESVEADSLLETAFWHLCVGLIFLPYTAAAGYKWDT